MLIHEQEQRLKAHVAKKLAETAAARASLGDKRFASAKSALDFAYKYETERLAMTPHAKLIKSEPTGTGMGLIGEAAAAQAGMILARVARLSDPTEQRKKKDDSLWVSALAKHFVAARVAPMYLKCECGNQCCSGRKPAGPWYEATDAIAHAALQQLKGRTDNHRLRLGIVRRFFGAKLDWSDIAKVSQVKRDTVVEHNSLLSLWLKKEDAHSWKGICEALRRGNMTD